MFFDRTENNNMSFDFVRLIPRYALSLTFFFFSTIHQNKPTKIYRLFSLDILSTINHISFTRLVAFSLSLTLFLSPTT